MAVVVAIAVGQGIVVIISLVMRILFYKFKNHVFEFLVFFYKIVNQFVLICRIIIAMFYI